MDTIDHNVIPKSEIVELLAERERSAYCRTQAVFSKIAPNLDRTTDK
jgi:hypothetical protein